ncbi:MAG: hypothetical protein Q7S60_03305 [bacterium]|nr:hypothetical protein [bacterium]
MKPKKTSNITVFAVLTTLTILTWVGFEIYQAFNKPGMVAISEEVLAPLTPSLNKTVLDNMEQRRFFEPGAFQVATTNPAPVEEPIEEASPSGQVQQ